MCGCTLIVGVDIMDQEKSCGSIAGLCEFELETSEATIFSSNRIYVKGKIITNLKRMQ